MITHKTIPKAYRPQVLTPINRNKSIVDFNKDFEKLFFQHLERVQTSNSITLEIEKGHLANILSRVDDFLSKLKTTPDHIAQLYDNFIHQNHIVREIPKQLEKLLPQDHVNPSTIINPNTSTPQDPDNHDTSTMINPSTPTQLKKSNCKRKSRSEHPTGRKSIKRDHFLSRGPRYNPQLP